MWKASINVDGLQVASVEGMYRNIVVQEALHYASQYEDETEKRMTITIRKCKENDNAR